MVYIGLMNRQQAHTKILRYIAACGGKIFKVYFNIFMLYAKCNEINIHHLDAENHISYTGSHKSFLMVMLGNGWKCTFNCSSWIIFIMLNFNALCDAYTV